MEIYITSSRRPSRRTRSFIKDLALILNAKRFNRGKSSIAFLLQRLNEESRLIIVSTAKGNPSKLDIYSKSGLLANFLIRKVKLLREFKSDVIKKVNTFKFSLEDDTAKEFIEILGIKDVAKKESIVLTFHPSNIEEFKDYKEVKLMFDSKNLGTLFYIKRLK